MRDLKPGDVIKCQGITCTIKDISWQEPWKHRKSYCLEFTDTDGNYRSWKQNIDGGEVILNEDVTDTYKAMIEAFECDFGLAAGGAHILSQLQELIDDKDERLMKDIHLLEELSFGLRHGTLKIMEVNS